MPIFHHSKSTSCPSICSVVLKELLPLPSQAPCLDWEDAWEHALKDCQVAVVLRVALDDNSQSVIMWAADALAQLVALESIGPSRACPTPSGCKKTFFVHLQEDDAGVSVEADTCYNRCLENTVLLEHYATFDHPTGATWHAR